MAEALLAVKARSWYYKHYNAEMQMFALKITQIGNSAGVVLPREALAKLGVAKGDTVYLTEAPDGAMQISVYDPHVAQQIALGEEVMDEYRDTFRALAK